MPRCCASASLAALIGLMGAGPVFAQLPVLYTFLRCALSLTSALRFLCQWPSDAFRRATSQDPRKFLRYSLEYCCWPFTLVLGVLRLECHRRRRAFTLVLEPGPALSSITATLAWLHRSLPFVCADPVFLVSFTAASSLTPLLILKP